MCSSICERCYVRVYYTWLYASYVMYVYVATYACTCVYTVVARSLAVCSMYMCMYMAVVLWSLG